MSEEGERGDVSRGMEGGGCLRGREQPERWGAARGVQSIASPLSLPSCLYREAALRTLFHPYPPRLCPASAPAPRCFSGLAGCSGMPMPGMTWQESWKAMEQLYLQKKVHTRWLVGGWVGQSPIWKCGQLFQLAGLGGNMVLLPFCLPPSP